METKFADIFLDAWTSVLESVCTKQIVCADIMPPKEYTDNTDLLVFMGLVGDVNGQIHMSMDAETAKILTSEMLGGMEVKEVDELVFSAVGELCNMVMGNACSSINLTNLSVDITPPTVYSEQNIPQLTIKACYRIAVNLENLNAIDFNVELILAGAR